MQRSVRSSKENWYFYPGKVFFKKLTSLEVHLFLEDFSLNFHEGISNLRGKPSEPSPPQLMLQLLSTYPATK